MKTTRHLSTGLSALLALALLCAPFITKAAESPFSGNANQVTDYYIGPADVLSILVWDQENMDRTVTVRPDGMISVPLVGELRVAGMTPGQLQEEITNRLQEFINIGQGEVTILVEEVHSYQVSVIGEVNLPGRFEFQSRTTVLDALAQAGGLTEFAQLSDILILRQQDEGTSRISFNYRSAAKSGENPGNHLLLPGDIILVP